MPIRRNPPSGLPVVDVTSLTPFNRDGATATGAGAYVTILSITGKGFLESFYAKQDAANAGFKVRITVDGVVKVLLGNASTKIIGVVNKNTLGPSSASTSAVLFPNDTLFTGNASGQPTALKQYPITDGTDGVIMLGDSKIYFTQSLLLESFVPVSSIVTYHYDGASL